MKSIRSFLLLATLVTPVQAGEISRLCEMDSKGSPKGCFYVQKSSLPTIIRDYSTGGQVAKSNNCDKPNGLRCQPLWGDQTGDPIGYPGVE
ncbi:MAG: hypothetical protein RJB24_32 [Candidatus Parcubacteria bacterium]|jgi:hypothetical protein